MDARNNTSFPSSSANNEDDDQDSRVQSISAFFNSTGSPPASSPFFDNLAFLDSNPNHQLPWYPTSLPASWPTSNPNPNPNVNDVIVSNPNSITPVEVLQPTPTTSRNSKKRSRASRRASTTVLTTDTSNFRAMVQEFTGIPAPPFPSSSFPRARFDVLRSSAFINAMAPQQPYLSQPFVTSSSTNASTTFGNNQHQSDSLFRQFNTATDQAPVSRMEHMSEFNRIVADIARNKLDKEEQANLNSGVGTDHHDHTRVPGIEDMINSSRTQLRPPSNEYGSSIQDRSKMNYSAPVSPNFDNDK